MNSELIFNLGDFRRRLWTYGDGLVNAAAVLTQSIDIDASEDEGYTVSLGDIMITCGIGISFIALGMCKNRRLNVRVLLPVVKGETAYTNEPRIDQILDVLDKWSKGDDDVDLQGGFELLNNVYADLPPEKMFFEPEEEVDPLEEWIPLSKPLKRELMWPLTWTLRYALTVEDECEDPKRLAHILDDLVLERELRSQEIPVDMQRMLAHIVTLSPPHALIDRGYSTSDQP